MESFIQRGENFTTTSEIVVRVKPTRISQSGSLRSVIFIADLCVLDRGSAIEKLQICSRLQSDVPSRTFLRMKNSFSLEECSFPSA